MALSSKKKLNEKVGNRDGAPPTSRYKGSRYYKRYVAGVGSNRIEPESWFHDEIPESDQDLYTKIKAGEEGRLDLVSLRVYKVESLWWVIAFANDIIDPFEEATVGRLIRYPPFDYVASNVLV